MHAPPDLLFVYGTLRPALACGWPRQLVGDLHVAGMATVAGTLYDLGEYPGMVPGGGVVHGDLLRLTDVDRLAAIDAYELCGGPDALFRRETAQATLADGSQVAVWVYFYNLPLDPAHPIASGDYLRHRTGR